MNQTLRDTILATLEDFSNDEDGLLVEMRQLVAEHGKSVYSVILNILASIDLSNAEAENYWQKIILHYAEMKSDLGRSVSLRTAICDYFCTVHKYLKNPKVIEIHLYEKTAQFSKLDELTGLLNRRVFNEVFTREVSRAERHHSDLSLLFFDLDNFKLINDTYGHLGGDLILKSVAEIIRKRKRIEDVAVRYGGEEILLLLPDTPKVHAHEIGERIRQEIDEARFVYEGRVLKVTISGGLASYPYDTTAPQRLVEAADSALYSAKAAGKNRIVLFSGDKRRYVRVDCHGDIKLKEQRFNDDIMHAAQCRDISRGGMMVESSDNISPGTRLLTQFTLQDEKQQLFASTVVRVEPSSEDKFNIGMSFLDIDYRTGNELAGFVMNRI
ncbi:MAG: diguanylate cyclase [Proteobacteria bacterium]|nr:diguanylate cyclase [Pseudomonadota bacterium]MBU1710954.1 diguanylate cyclase [Pseudomonadota bacterium]